MRPKQMDDLIQQLENYTECWKQFNRFINMARAKKFGPEDESQFLEVKSVMIQQLELILSNIESGTPEKDEVLALISAAPSLRHLSEMSEGSVRNVESNWHKMYIGWHSVLGQLKVQQRKTASEGMFSRLFGKRK